MIHLVARRCALQLALPALVSACTLLPPIEPLPVDLEARSARIASEVATLRALPLERDVTIGVRDTEEIVEAFRALIAREWTEEDDGAERAYKRFGLLPPELDLKEYLADFYGNQVAGYYDPKVGSFFVVREPTDPEDPEAGSVELDFVIAHELVHALQDQHFDLEGLQERHERNDDRMLAVSALTEGDGMLGGFDYLLWRMGAAMTSASPLGRSLAEIFAASADMAVAVSSNPDARALREAPEVIRTGLMFPYVEGTVFAAALRAEFGWSALDQAFADPPESSEQIIHPERYIDRRDRPVAIELAEPPAGWSALFDETLGMLDMRILLREELGAFASRAAEGWDGDRYGIWQAPHGEALVWLTVWDTERQARRFERVYRRLLDRKRGVKPWAVRRRGDVVAAVEAPLVEDAALLSERLIESRVERAINDQPPEGLVRRTLRWPLSVRRLDRVWEVSLLGGRLLRYRRHQRGHLLGVLGAALLRSERNPDRTSLGALLDLVGYSADRQHGYRRFCARPLLDVHARGQDEGRSLSVRVAKLPLLPDLLRFDSSPASTGFSLLGSLGVSAEWGPAVPGGRRVTLLFIPLPGL